MAVVTVSRLLGSEGDVIALKVAEGLGYDLVDTKLIVEVAERTGVSISKVRDYDEKYRSRAVEWLKGFISPRMSKILAGEDSHLDPKTFVEYVKTIILGLSEKGKMVIVGRAGQFILKDFDSAFHVRIIADKKFRIERLKERHDISESNAIDMMVKSDNMRKHYMERYFNADWEDTIAYHLILNSSKLGIDETEGIIIEAVKNFSATHEFIPGVKDRRKYVRRKGNQRKRNRRSGEDLWTQKDTQRAISQGRAVRSLTKPDRRKGEHRKGDRRKS